MRSRCGMWTLLRGSGGSATDRCRGDRRAVVQQRVEPVGLDGRDVQVDRARDDPRARLEQAAARVGDEADHALAEAEVPQRLGDRARRPLGQLDAVGEIVEELDAIGKAVAARARARGRPPALLDREDARRARLAGEVGQQAGAGPDVDDDIARPHDPWIASRRRSTRSSSASSEAWYWSGRDVAHAAGNVVGRPTACRPCRRRPTAACARSPSAPTCGSRCGARGRGPCAARRG